MRKPDRAFVREHGILKYSWMLFSVIFLVIILTYNWNNNLLLIKNDLQEIAQETQDDMEKMIGQFMRVLFALPVYGKHFTNCKTQVLPLLEKVVSRNTHIAGLAISDHSNQAMCSTFPENQLVDRKKPFYGPVNFGSHENNLFLLQQQLGDYHIRIYFTEALLTNTLKLHAPEHVNVLLYDNVDHKIVASSNKNITSNESFLKVPHGMSALPNIESLNIITTIAPRIILKKQLISSTLITLIFTIFSLILYMLSREVLNKRYSLQAHLRSALKNKQFFPMFQPVFDVQNNQFIGAEVLMRWRTAENEIIMPETFIEEAEKTALIVPLTLQIADMAMNHYKNIIKPDSPFYLAFNVSAHHFTSETFFMDFIKLVEIHDLQYKEILFELTERDLINKNDSIFNEKMQLLRKLNFSLAIDDFGTGHANISYLQHFPFNYLKIDKLFVQSIGTGSVTESLIDTIINMAKLLHLTVIAEGIEEQSQIDYLIANNVQYLQGWYYAKAIPAEELHILIKGS